MVAYFKLRILVLTSLIFNVKFAQAENPTGLNQEDIQESVTSIFGFQTNNRHYYDDYVVTDVISEDYVTRPALYEDVKPKSYVAANRDESYDDLLDFIEQNMISYGEDVLGSCIDEDEVKFLIQNEVKALRRTIRQLFILTLILFAVALVLSIAAVISNCCKNVKKRRPSKSVIKYKKKSFTNEGENSLEFTDVHNSSFDPDSVEGSPDACDRKTVHVYSVQV